MIGILKIDLPDDFEKGKCWKCPIKEVDFEYDCISCKVGKWVMHDAYDLDTNQVLTSDCPLEIQHERNGDCETCKHYEYPACYCETECKYEPYIPTGSEGE